MEFQTVEKEMLFARMRLDVIVIGITFAEFMVKLRHTDTTWKEINS